MSKGKLVIMGRNGDTTKTWDTEKAETVAEVEKFFNMTMAATPKPHAVAIDKPGTPGEFIDNFKPDAEEIVMFGQLGGG